MTKIVRMGDITGFDDAEIIELEEENSKIYTSYPLTLASDNMSATLVFSN